MKYRTNDVDVKKPSKIKSIFAILYFATTVASLLFYTATAIKYVVKEGWTPINIVMIAFIGLSYLILLACIVLSKNIASAKSAHSKTKKMLRLGKKIIKIVHFVPTMLILFSTSPADFLDIVSRVFSVLSLIMHVVSLINTINMMFTKFVVKKAAKKGKEKLVSTISDFKNYYVEGNHDSFPPKDNDNQQYT